MSKISNDPVFQPVNDLFEELIQTLAALEGNPDLIDANVKVVLMKAYQRGQNVALDTVRSWLP